MDKPNRLEIKDGKLYINDEEFYLASGDMHYFRTQRDGWRRRLRLMKAFGLTAVQTYVPWNLHEPRKGCFHFEGNLDLRAFLEMCTQEGLYVLLRPSPYICSEWDFGGLPYWLLKEQDMCIRTTDEKYMKHVREYYARLFQEIVPMLSVNGGPVIAVAIENEYGSFAMDLEYLRAIEKMYRELGVDVPLYTAGGSDLYMQIFGGFPEIWSGIDLRNNIASAVEEWKQFQTGFPPFLAEYWSGNALQWGAVFPRQNPETVVANYREALHMGAYVNFYMFCGSTNFGFMNGALEGTFRRDVPGAKIRYVPFLTSYDGDALVSEDGNATEKYRKCRAQLAAYRGIREEDLPPVLPPVEAQTIGRIEWEGTGRLFEGRILEAVTEKCVRSGNVRTMESLDQDYGWILYTTHILRTDPNRTFVLQIEGLRDRADIYCDGEYKGTYYRDRDNAPVEFQITRPCMRLDILVENMGRICFGYAMLDNRKGILGCVRLDTKMKNGAIGHNNSFVSNWESRTLPMRYEKVQGIATDPVFAKASGSEPRFFRGSFSAKPGAGTFLNFHTPGMTKGCVWINGLNLGRYWSIGPQDTLYVPGEIIKEKNVIEIFELYSDGTVPTVYFQDHAQLDSLTENVE